MKSFEFDDADIVLVGDSGNRIGWGQWAYQNGSICRLWVMIESEWYKARIEIETSRERLENLRDQLKQLSQLEIAEVYFSAGDGVYEMSLKRGPRGNVSVTGTLSRSLAEDPQLTYAFESHLADIDNFGDALEKFLTTWNVD